MLLVRGGRDAPSLVGYCVSASREVRKLIQAVLILGAIAAPFAIHEAGHWALSRIWGIPDLAEAAGAWYGVSSRPWSTARGAAIAIAGFWAEVLGPS